MPDNSVWFVPFFVLIWVCFKPLFIIIHIKIREKLEKKNQQFFLVFFFSIRQTILVIRNHLQFQNAFLTKKRSTGTTFRSVPARQHHWVHVKKCGGCPIPDYTPLLLNNFLCMANDCVLPLKLTCSINAFSVNVAHLWYGKRYAKKVALLNHKISHNFLFYPYRLSNQNASNYQNPNVQLNIN